MDADKYKVIKNLFKYYLIYHLIFDFCILGLLTYWHFSDSQSIWYHRIVNNPMMLIDLFVTRPISIIGEIINIIVRILLNCF